MTTRFTLPKTVQARNWVRSTDTLRGHLLDRLSTIRQRAAAKRKEAEEIEAEGASLEQAIALLDQILPRKPAATPLPAAEKPALPADSSPKRFSLMYDRCQKCGRGAGDGVRHAARGLCHGCYWVEQHPKSGEVSEEPAPEVAHA